MNDPDGAFVVRQTAADSGCEVDDATASLQDRWDPPCPIRADPVSLRLGVVLFGISGAELRVACGRDDHCPDGVDRHLPVHGHEHAVNAGLVEAKVVDGANDGSSSMTAQLSWPSRIRKSTRLPVMGRTSAPRTSVRSSASMRTSSRTVLMPTRPE